MRLHPTFRVIGFSIIGLVISQCVGQSAGGAEAPPSAPRPAAASSRKTPAEATKAPAAESGQAAAAEAKDAAEPQYELKYKLRAGEALRCEVVHRATVETLVQGTTQKAETRSKSIKVWRVTNVTSRGEITFVHAVESIDLWQNMQGHQPVHYNSQTDKEIPPGYEQAAAAVGVPLTEIVMDLHGTIIKREQKHPQPDMQSPQIAMPLPAKAVPVGHTWTAPLDIEVMVTGGTVKKIRTQQKFTLEKVANDLATIRVETQVLTPINDPTIEAQLVQRLSDGTIHFDLSAGRVVDQQLDLDRRVLGFSGPGSSMHYLTRYTEKLLPADATATAQKPQPAKSK